MPGPVPKRPDIRARGRRSATAATLTEAVTTRTEAALPEGYPWHDMTRRFWRRLWASEMASEFVDADIDQLYMLARTVNDYWTAESASLRASLSAEIRLLGRRFGLSPLDRRSLDWQVSRTERETKAKPAPKPVEREDPRELLRLLR